MMVAAEATWVSLLLAAAINGANGPKGTLDTSGTGATSAGVHVHVPFLALALPAVIAAAAFGLTAKLPWRWWWKIPLVAGALVVGTALSAGLISELSRSGSWWQVATTPWNANGHSAAVIAGAAWFLSILAWGRGLWLAMVRPSFHHAAWTLGLGALAFIGIFAGRADHQATSFLTSTRNAGWLLFLFFPLCTAAVALVRERDIEATLLAGGGSGPGLVWLSVLAGPMFGVAILALALAFVIGPGARVAGRLVVMASEAIGAAVAAVARWIWSLRGAQSHAHLKTPKSLPRPVTPPALHTGRPVHPSFSIPAVVWEILAVLLVVLLVRFLIRNVGPILAWRGGRSGQVPDEERSSVFSWRHFLEQLRAGVSHWLRRRGKPAAVGRESRADLATGDADVGSVRRAYRVVLAAARASGSGRESSETAREMESRLSAGMTPDPVGALRELTSLYDAARYGSAETDDPTDVRAMVHADVVRSALEDKIASG